MRGALRPTETFPPDLLFPPPRTSLGRSSKSSTLRAPQSEKGKVPPEPPWVRPPKLSLGWIWALGKTAHFSRTQALPHVISHKSTKLGAPSQRWGMGWSYRTHTHTRTGSETNQLISLRLQRLNHCPFGVWGQCLNSRHHPST